MRSTAASVVREIARCIVKLWIARTYTFKMNFTELYRTEVCLIEVCLIEVCHGS